MIDEINRSQYTFMYAENGTVFHRYDCHLFQNANQLLETILYDTIASKCLRSCKVCKPFPADMINPLVAQQNVRRRVAPQKKELRSSLTPIRDDGDDSTEAITKRAFLGDS